MGRQAVGICRQRGRLGLGIASRRGAGPVSVEPLAAGADPLAGLRRDARTRGELGARDVMAVEEPAPFGGVSSETGFAGTRPAGRPCRSRGAWSPRGRARCGRAEAESDGGDEGVGAGRVGVLLGAGQVPRRAPRQGRAARTATRARGARQAAAKGRRSGDPSSSSRSSSAAEASPGRGASAAAVIPTAVPKPLSASSSEIRASGAGRPRAPGEHAPGLALGHLDLDRLAGADQAAHPRLHPLRGRRRAPRARGPT